MANNSRNYWFRSKYGFGWYPSSIKGILVFIVYFSSLGYIFFQIDKNSQSLTDTVMNFAPFLFGATIILLFICYLTGEPIKEKDLKI